MKTRNAKLNVSLVANHNEVAQEMLELFVNTASKVIKQSGRFCVGISRHTPGNFFDLLGSDFRSKSLPWNQVYFFCVDECCCSSDLDNNKYSLATSALVPKVDMPAGNVHRICSRCRSCEFAASIYEQTIYNVVGQKKNGVPRFDLVLLRMGLDGHIASLFPDTYTFFQSESLVQPVYFMDGRHTRITVTHPVLYAASHIAVWVCGQEKAAILRQIFTSKSDIAHYPIHALWPVLEKVTWLVDQDAARFLSEPTC